MLDRYGFSHFGRTVHSHELSSLTSGDLKRALLDHRFLIVRGFTDLSPSQVIKLTENFGYIWESSQGHDFFVNGDPRILRISNDDKSQRGLFGSHSLEWHQDFAHSPGNYHGSLIYNKTNGELAKTIVCDLAGAFLDLDDDLKRQLRPVTGFHTVSASAYREEFSAAQLRLLRQKRFRVSQADYSFDCIHHKPTSRRLVQRHPVTGIETLYLSPATLVTTTPKLPAETWDRLIEHVTNELYIYKHTWQSNDILILDNFSSMHRRDSFDGNRVLYRSQFDYLEH